MGQITATILILLAFWSSRASASYCERPCKDRCTTGGSFLGYDYSAIDPVCFSECKARMASECWDFTDPFAAAVGEVGAQAYPAATQSMLQRNRSWREMKELAKRVLRPFYGDLVDKVHIHTNARLLDSIGTAPFAFDIHFAEAQTFGYSIFIRGEMTDANRYEWVTVLGHELCHVQQFVDRGSSLSHFGRDYFESLYKGGGYFNAGMENECESREQKFTDRAVEVFQWHDEHERRWDFQVCNESGFEEVFVALAWHHKFDQGFTLVAYPVAKGWWSVKKGQCRTLLKDLDSGEQVYSFVTSGAAGNWAFWGGGDLGRKFCVNPTKAFTLEGDDLQYCKAEDTEWVKFNYITNPWRTSGQGVHSRVVRGEPTDLQICNKSGKSLEAAMLRFERGRWRSSGWYVFNEEECKDFTLGFYKTDVYIWARQASDHTIVWSDNTQLGFCVHPSERFEYIQDDPCVRGATLVHGHKKTLSPGRNRFSFGE